VKLDDIAEDAISRLLSYGLPAALLLIAAWAADLPVYLLP
jgi:hypothetical protein